MIIIIIIIIKLLLLLLNYYNIDNNNIIIMIKIIKVNLLLLLLLLLIDLINFNNIIPVNTFHHFLYPYKLEMNITKFRTQHASPMIGLTCGV